MANKRPKPEEIVSKLRQVEMPMRQGKFRLDAIRQIGVVALSALKIYFAQLWKIIT